MNDNLNDLVNLGDDDEVEQMDDMDGFQISIWVDYKNDESYTPNRITVRAGTHFGDLQDLRTVELDRPCGWIDIQISGDEILRIKQQFKLNTNYEDDSDEELITFPATESFPVVR
ncbi:12461_t:CDS:2 [Entrophospora sp. SA101]|nr:12461_t:CDS:2 [Entrophospora sp. SA101]CAJ0892321.1 5512_t:CDS:2 [Entrophospora sp. SA101]